MKFTWDIKKARKVFSERRISFDKISDVFEDSFSLDLIDEKHSTPDEDRFIIVGKTAEYGLIHLVYTMPSDAEIHFVTARRAGKWFINQYEKNLRRT